MPGPPPASVVWEGRERRARVTLDEWTEAWIASGDDSTLTEYMASHHVPPPPAPPADMDPSFEMRRSDGNLISSTVVDALRMLTSRWSA